MLHMTEGEIVARYNQAKNRMAQIKILAELNSCDKGEIVDVLKARGCELPGQYTKKKVETPEAAMRQPETPEASELTEPAKDWRREYQRAAAGKIAAEDVLNLIFGVLEDLRELPDEADAEQSMKSVLSYIAGAADAYKALQGPIVR